MQEKKILDACFGSRMFWFDKNNPEVEFCVTPRAGVWIEIGK